jgi:hypothetical protein
VPVRLISLRFPSSCCLCDQPLLAKSKAFYDNESKAVTCQSCIHSSSTPDRSDRAEVTSDAPDLEVGVAGAGPQREYERRSAKRDERIEQKWGRLAPVAKFLSDEPQHTAAFSKGAEGERRLAAHLEREVGDGAILLHSRKIPNGDIDHLAIAPSGIYVIDAKNYTGRIEARDVGNWRTVDRRLYVGGRDKSKLLEGMAKQVGAVTRALGPSELADTPIHPVLCFTNSEWGLFAKPLSFGPVSCLWAKRLCELIRQPGPLGPTRRYSTATLLSAALPAAS